MITFSMILGVLLMGLGVVGIIITYQVRESGFQAVVIFLLGWILFVLGDIMTRQLQ